MPAVTQGRVPAAVLVGLDTLQGLQAARILAARCIPVIALARDPGHPACRTRVCQTIIHGDTDGPGLVDALAALGRTLQMPAVLFPCHDQSVALISAHRDALAHWYRIVLPDPPVVELLMAKDRFYEFARREGFRVPRLRQLRDSTDLEGATRDLRFPCILKPSRRAAEWDRQTTAKALHVETPAELLAVYAQVRTWAPVMVVQELIPGGDSELYSCNLYFNRAGEPAATFVARKLRQWPPRMGSSCLGEEVRNDAVLAAALRLFRRVDYRGLGYVEMKRDPRDGEYCLIEANVGRPTGRSAIAEAGGVPLLYTMYCDALGLPVPTGLEQSYAGVKWLDFRRDCQSAIHYWRCGELTIGEWLASLRGRKAHAVFSWSDPAPFAWDLWRTLRVALSGSERARRAAAFNDSRAVASAPAGGREST